MLSKYIEHEMDICLDGKARVYWIDSFPVCRSDFLYHLGDPTPEIVEKLKAGEIVEKNDMKFWVEGWDRI